MADVYSVKLYRVSYPPNCTNFRAWVHAKVRVTDDEKKCKREARAVSTASLPIPIHHHSGVSVVVVVVKHVNQGVATVSGCKPIAVFL